MGDCADEAGGQSFAAARLEQPRVVLGCAGVAVFLSVAATAGGSRRSGFRRTREPLAADDHRRTGEGVLGEERAERGTGGVEREQRGAGHDPNVRELRITENGLQVSPDVTSANEILQGMRAPRDPRRPRGV